MRRAQAFTLIEVIIAVFILMLLLAMAVPSLTGVLADQRLRQSLDSFNRLVREAQNRSISEHRPFLLVWRDSSVELRPEFLLPEDDPNPIATYPLPKGASLTLDLTAALTKEPPAEWIFWATGTCEPATIKFAGRDGVWMANYSPLTATAELKNYAAR
jgi:type II secretory pathway pseudopilin PulG